MIRIKRVYEPVEKTDGMRVLVDRLWPRGLTKEAAALDEWLRDIAPSTSLRQWFHTEPRPWAEFVARYRTELAEPQCAAHLKRLGELAKQGTVTLLYAVRDEERNHAIIVRDAIGESKAKKK
jgi:uncharacterized protein YeaO (DUF488 family)